MQTVLLDGFGCAHTAWTTKPVRAAIIALLIFLCVATLSWALDIHWTVHDASGSTYKGFLRSHWGPLFFVAMPIATLIMSLLFRALDEALVSLNRIIVPADENTPLFSVWLAQRFRIAWGLWIFPACVALPVALSLVADGSDILAPLEAANLPPSGDKDWVTLGYLQSSNSPLWYLLFNLLAFGLQAFLGYCGFLLIFVVSFLLWIFARYGLGGRKWTQTHVLQTNSSAPISYTVQWDYDDDTGRCGLFLMDRVFAFYVGLIFISLGIAAWSVLANEASVTGIDKGSAILAFCNLLLLPLAFVWILIPYWIRFPRQLPRNAKARGCVDPRPWPFGAEKLSWSIIGTTWVAWLYLFKKAWDGVRVFLGIY